MGNRGSGKDTLKRGGLSALWHKSVRKLKSIEEDYDYNEWYKKEKTGAEELSRQRAAVWENPLLFSIVIPVYRPKEAFLRRLLDSILSQTYPHFEICPCGCFRAFRGYFGKWRKVPGFGFTGSIRRRTAGCVLSPFPRIWAFPVIPMPPLPWQRGDFIIFSDHDDELYRRCFIYHCQKH